jgi:hypothetical protein
MIKRQIAAVAKIPSVLCELKISLFESWFKVSGLPSLLKAFLLLILSMRNKRYIDGTAIRK